MHDPESPHFVIGSTRNTNSTMLLYSLAQLVGDKTFGILKELRRFFVCVCVICLYRHLQNFWAGSNPVFLSYSVLALPQISLAVKPLFP